MEKKWQEHNEELLNFYPSPNIFRAVNSKRVGCTENIARMEDLRHV